MDIYAPLKPILPMWELLFLPQMPDFRKVINFRLSARWKNLKWSISNWLARMNDTMQSKVKT